MAAVWSKRQARAHQTVVMRGTSADWRDVLVGGRSRASQGAVSGSVLAPPAPGQPEGRRRTRREQAAATHQITLPENHTAHQTRCAPGAVLAVLLPVCQPLIGADGAARHRHKKPG